MADRNLVVVKQQPIWMQQAEEAKIKSEAEKTAAAKAAFDATFKDVDKNKKVDDSSDSDGEGDEAEEDLANKPIGPVDPAKCTAAGTGIAGGTACAPSSFTVVTKDSDGRKVPNGGAEIKVRVSPGVGVGGSDQDGVVKDMGDGTYTVTYVVPKRGNYMVNIDCNGKAIMGSPFPVFFSQGTTTGGLLGLAPTASYPNLVNQTMPNMPNYSGPPGRRRFVNLAAEAQAVKSLNKSPGRRRFVFKTFSQRVEEIEIDVFRSLDPLKSEPSEGSSFFRDHLVEWRELNTAEDFISFYEEITPLVQTLPQIILHRELILSKLLSRLHVEGRLSLEPILRLIAALSRDLLEDFPPFLQRVADSLVSLLKGGADRDPEIIEQIFTSWSYIMMYLQKYLVRDVVHVLRVSAKLRYYPKEYVQEFMAEAVAFLLRNAPIEQLIKGTRKVMLEVAKKPLVHRKSGVSALLWYVMRGASQKLHSRAEQVLRLLMDGSIIELGDKFVQGSQSVLEVVTTAFQRLCEELEPAELNVMLDCVFEEITDAVSSGCSLHLSRLLSLLSSTVHEDYIQKNCDYQLMLQVVDMVMQKFVLPSRIVKTEDQSSEVVDKLLHLVICILDGLPLADDGSVLSGVSVQWAPLFELRNSRLLTFIRQLLLKDPCIIHAFRRNILSALSDLIETSEEEVILLLLIFCERMEAQVQSTKFLDGTSGLQVSRICTYLQDAIGYWIGVINQIVNGDPSSIQLQETKLALLWGIISCYPFMNQGNSSLLLDFVDALDRLLGIEYDNIAGFHKHTWQSLIGAALSSFNKLTSGNLNGEAVSTYLQVAARYKSSSQILSAVADYLDSMDWSTFKEETSSVLLHPEFKGEKATESMAIFAENLCHSDKVIRISTLRILRHYQLLHCEHSPKDEPAEIEMKTEVCQSCFANNQGCNVLHLLQSIEDTPLSITTSRKVILLISRIQMGLSGARIAETYLPSVLYGVIGIFHNRFSYLWDPASECIAVLISKYFDMTWNIFVQYLEQCESNFLASDDQSDRSRSASTSKSSDLGQRFDLFVSPASDSTPCMTVLTLLIQTLQKVPTVVESRSKQIVPLFLKFMGYNVNDVVSVGSFNTWAIKGKGWKNVLKEWLTLLKLMRNPKSFYRGQFLKEVLQYRLLEENDAETQMKVLDCLLNWKDDFLVPYDQHLKNLISSKSLREELTTWSLSKDPNLIEQHHRSYLVPLVTRVLIPKVRKLKTLASRKHTSVHHRRAILGFLAQLDVDELGLFFALLMKPLISISQGFDGMNKWFWSSPERSEEEFDSSSFLKYFTVENIMALSWKKRYAFLHVIEDIFGVFDELHVKPYLDLLMGCIVRILWSCTSSIDSGKNSDLSVVETHSSFRLTLHEKGGGAENQITASIAIKQLKELRSLCLKIISLALNKYEDHEFGCEFWDLFFNSVKPLIDGFKQEGASSEKPSSLFSCFLTMSGSYKLISLLYKEESLVPDIFSILTVPTASEAILSCVLKFVENLLNLDSELNDEDNATKRILLPNLDALISGLHCLFKFNNTARRKLVKCPGERELSIFKLLMKYIKDPSSASKFVDIMLPLLTNRVQNSDACVEALHVIREVIPVLGSERTAEVLNAVSPLLTSVSLDLRISVCDLLDALAGTDSSLIAVVKLVRELNSNSAMEMGGLDYDSAIGAYEKINKDFFYTVREQHALLILSHAVHDMSSEELILRQSAFRLLLSYVEFSVEVLEREMKSDDQSWPESSIERIINKFLLKHMGDAMNKDSSIQKVWIDLLREMVLKLSMVPSLKSFKVLCSEDAEQDFFNNIMHLQKHRRARALLRFRSIVSSSTLSEVITIKVFVPLFFNMLFELQRGKAENVRSACLEALASIAGNMDWKSYYAFLMRCFREMTQKSDMQKVLLRLICSVLDRFHYLETHSGQEAKGFVAEESKTVLNRCSSSAVVTEIQECLLKNVLPKIQKLLISDSDNVNVHVSIVALKILKLLPGDVMELQLPSIVHRVSNFLKHRLESIRDEARDALAACLKELGLEYLEFIVKVLRATLKRGYELHVLGYTLNFILSKFLVNPVAGKLDYCLEDLLSVVENDILGDVSEEKEVDKIASKMKETRKLKSFETLKLLAQNITFKTHGVKLLSRVSIRLQKNLTPKLKLKLEAMLNNIAAGIECNPSVNQTDLFIFLYDLIEAGITHENHPNTSSSVTTTKKKSGDRPIGKIITAGRLIDSGSQSSHLVTVFALGLLHSCMKKTKLQKKDELVLSMLDPFVRLLTVCLTSKYEDIISGALRCLTPLVGLPLPALRSQGDKIKTSLLVIAHGSLSSSPLMQSCLRLLTVLLRNPRITLTADQLHTVIQFPLFVDLERNPSSLALSLLKAIVNRKLVVHEIYDLVSRVAELMVTSQVESIRKICSQILLQFLLDYSLSEKRMLQHLDFLLSNLSYEHSSGRETVLEMLHAIVMKFPKAVVDEHSLGIFVRLVFCLANDNDNKVRSMTGAAIKLLIGRVSPDSLHSIIEYSFSWYLGGKQDLCSAAAQVLGLLVEGMKNGFQKYINSVLPVMRSIFQSAIDDLKNGQLDLSNEATWKGAYYSLIMLEKILHQFHYLCLAKDLENIWEVICELLLHPHMWLRNVLNRLVALYFASVIEADRSNHDKSLGSFFLMRPSRLFLIAVSLCCQLKAPLIDDATSPLITQNLTFVICALQPLLGPNKLVGAHSIWSTVEHYEQGRFLEAFQLLDSGKGGSMFASLASEDNSRNAEENSDHHQSLLVSYLLKRMGKIALEMEAVQMKIIFNVFKSISPKIIDVEKFSSQASDFRGYAYPLLLPLYKVCEGYAGKVIPDDVKQLAQEALESIRDTLGMNNFVQVYSHIRKNLKVKRDKRKQGEKVMAVVNPERNAQRKRRISAKNQVNKKRRVMAMKMTKWMR